MRRERGRFDARRAVPPERGAVAERLRGFTSTGHTFSVCIRGRETPQAFQASPPFRRGSRIPLVLRHPGTPSPMPERRLPLRPVHSRGNVPHRPRQYSPQDTAILAAEYSGTWYRVLRYLARSTPAASAESGNICSPTCKALSVFLCIFAPGNMILWQQTIRY